MSVTPGAITADQGLGTGCAGLDVTTRTARYAMYGVQVESDIPLPITPATSGPASAPAWVIRRQPPTYDLPVPAGALVDDHRMPDGSQIDQFYRSACDAWLWDHLAGMFHLEPALGRVTITPLPDADLDDLGLLIIGPVAAFLLQQAGYLTLHASAVVTAYGACAFMAPSTFGKSTLAAGHLRAGAQLLTDDLLPLDTRPDGVYGLPGAPMMKVWEHTAQGALGITDTLPRLSTLTEKRLLTLEQRAYPFAGDAAKLRAIYVPRRYDPARETRTDVDIEPLSPRDAVLALLSQTFRGHYLFPQELARLLQEYSQIVQRTRVAVLHMPTGFEYCEPVTERVLADLAMQ